MAACTPAFSDHVVGDLVGYADCQARALGSWGYYNLASSPMMSTLLFVALSIAIALFGIRMSSGRMPTLGDTLSATAAVGIVLTLLFSWPAVRVLLYDTTLDGPQAVASTVMRAPPDPTLVQRVEAVDRGVQSLILAGTGREQLASLNTKSGAPASSEFHSQGISDDIAFASGRYLLLSTAIVSLGGLKLLGGLIIALLPLFALLILFRATVSHFVAALASLMALATAGIATSILLMVELGYLESWLISTMEARAVNFAIASAPIELLLIASLFAALQLMAILLAFRICMRAGRKIAIVQAARESDDRRPAPNFSQTAPAYAQPMLIGGTREHRLVASLSRNPTYSQSMSTGSPLGTMDHERSRAAKSGSGTERRAITARKTRTAKKRDRQ